MTGLERRNVLVITLGGAPGVVTETAWALLNRKPPWVPHEIHLVTTTFGARDWLDPAARANRELAALFAHFGLPPVAPLIFVPETGDGQPIGDIRTEKENIAFANALTWRVMEIKARENTRLHVSMAGGRKTMSSYSHAAISYFAEEGDELTHILVDPPNLEYSPDFFWPGQEQQDIDVSKRPPPPPSKIVLASSASIDIVPSPFLRLRQHMKRIPFAKANFDHWTLTERVQAKLDAYGALVTLRAVDHALIVDGAPVALGEQEFALYRVLAAAMIESWPGVGPDGMGGNHAGWLLIADFSDRKNFAYRRFIDFYRACFEDPEDPAFVAFKERLEKALSARGKEGDDRRRRYLAKRFREIRAKLKKKLEDGVPSFAIRRRVTPVIKWVEGVGWSHGLALEPHELQIVPRGRVNE